jgi:phenylalanyl-tRNA synthetase beta chain
LETIAYNINRKNPNLKLYEFGNVYHKNRESGPSFELRDIREEEVLSIFVTGSLETQNWQGEQQQMDIYYLKGVLEAVLQKLGIFNEPIQLRESSSGLYTHSLEYLYREEVLANIAEVSPELLSLFEIKAKVFTANLNWEQVIQIVPSDDNPYKPVPKYPAVRRDLALLVDKQIRFESLREAAMQAQPKLLHEVGLFDIYEGENIPAGKKSYALSFTLQDPERTLTDKVIDLAMKKIQAALEKQFHATLR